MTDDWFVFITACGMITLIILAGRLFSIPFDYPVFYSILIVGSVIAFFGFWVWWGGLFHNYNKRLIQ